MKTKTKLIKLLTLLLVISILSTLLIGCGGDETPAGDATKLSFKAALEYDYLKGLDGKQVTMAVKPGDRVITSEYAGSRVIVEGVQYLVVRQNDILAVVE